MEAIAEIWIDKIIYDHFSVAVTAWTKWDACFNWMALAFSMSLPFPRSPFKDWFWPDWVGFDQIGIKLRFDFDIWVNPQNQDWSIKKTIKNLQMELPFIVHNSFQLNLVRG